MRRKRIYKKHYKPDSRYNRIDVSRFINYVMRDGKKTTAEKIVYKAFNLIQEQTKEDPVVVFEKAISNAAPLLEVVSRRIGGANYQIPVEVKPERRFILGSKWIIDVAKNKKGKPMHQKLAEEIMAAYKNEGDAIRKKQDMHKVAEANRAFAHFIKSN